MSRDLLDWIRTELARTPAVLPLVEPVLNQARQTFGGDTVYVRQEKRKVTTRTLQNRQRQCRQNA
mgnify:CR=1 FL=1